ncbi:helix-turn-helix transcriptional regulator [Streptomyces sp. NBC_01723]|uniref:winged helix-turn-helix transcriptional regulator n=1 Tax=Streptomyces sp. NBC_01723 TaxID=2975921 RepID=UPI002E377B6F|nr:helix-turn-helix domain-containing protein [Streptomyces sp. NBC_01723]
MAGATPRGAGIEPELACPVSPVLDIVFSRWTTPILWALHEYGRQRFVELQRNIGTITPKVLTQRLRRMERDGLVERTYHAEVPPRVEYEISDLGRSLGPIFASLVEWSAENLPEVERARREFDGADEPVAVIRRRGPAGAAAG